MCVRAISRPKTLPHVLQIAALRRPQDETQETSHGQIGSRARGLGHVGGTAAEVTMDEQLVPFRG